MRGDGAADHLSPSGINLPLMSFIISGGSGSRLWPLSREDRPKQFHALAGSASLLTQSLNRLTSPQAILGTVTLIGAQAHQSLLAKTLSEHQQQALHLGGRSADADVVRLILEPVARNTAAVAALATMEALQQAPDALVLLCPADHRISTDQQFWQTIKLGVPPASEGAVVIFGLVPQRADTGYGYIEAGNRCRDNCNHTYAVRRFVEKPDYPTATAYLQQGGFFWNSGIFLFRASVMQQAFMDYAPQIWAGVTSAFQQAERRNNRTLLPQALYSAVRSASFDCAVMEKITNRTMVIAGFEWSDLGSWHSLYMLPKAGGQPITARQDEQHNMIVGDVIAHDCHNNYLRSEAGLLAVTGLSDMAVICTKDATLITPLAHSRHIQRIVEQLKQHSRPELSTQPPASNYERVRSWLFAAALPVWAQYGADYRYGGFYEALSLQGQPLHQDLRAQPEQPDQLNPAAQSCPVNGVRRSRTMARQIYAFAQLSNLAAFEPAAGDVLPQLSHLVAHGLLFMQSKGRSRCGGWVSSFTADGNVHNGAETLYDQACMLLALAQAHAAGHNQAYSLAQQSFAFIDRVLAHPLGGFYEMAQDGAPTDAPLTSNAHMHYLEACLAWHQVSGEQQFLARSQQLVQLCSRYFFDKEYWSLGEYFDHNWQPLTGVKGEWADPGHHFEWASLLADYAGRADDPQAQLMAGRLYSFALAAGTNRQTGLAYNLVSRTGTPLDSGSRSWQQCEAIKAAIVLDGYNGQDLKPEIEARIERLFHYHLTPARPGLWIDRVDAQGAGCSDHVPASILYHLVSALSCYLKLQQPQPEPLYYQQPAGKLQPIFSA